MRLIARYAKALESGFEIVTVWDDKVEKEQVPQNDPRIKTLTKSHPAAIWFERKMHDDFGILIEDAFR